MTIKQAAIDLIVALKGHTLPREAEIAYNRLSKAVSEDKNSCQTCEALARAVMMDQTGRS